MVDPVNKRAMDWEAQQVGGYREWEAQESRRPREWEAQEI